MAAQDHFFEMQQAVVLSPGARAVWNQWVSYWVDDVWRPLEVPAMAVYQAAWKEAATDTAKAIQSVSHLCFIIWRPIALALFWLIRYLCRLFWQFVIVEGLSVQGWNYLVKSAKVSWEWQRSLTPEQVALEGAVLACLLQGFLVWRVLKRTRLIRRASDFCNKGRRSVVKSYQQGVARIASVSLWLAVMTPHALFGAASVSFALLFPGTLRFVATQTGLVGLLSQWIPVLATLHLLNDVAMEQESKELAEAEAEKTKKTTIHETPKRKKKISRSAATASPATPGFFPMTTPSTAKRRKRRRSSFLTPFRSSEPAIDDELELPERLCYWFEYWMVHATLQALKQIVRMLPLVGTVLVRYAWMDAALQQLELVFYVWLYVMPFLEIPSLPKKAPEGKPLAVLAPMAGKMACRVVQSTNVFTDEWWQAWPVRNTDLFLQVSTLIGLTSQPTADALRKLVSTGQSLLMPAITLLLPMGAGWGLLFVQYCLPLAHASKVQPTNHESSPLAATQLQYWILHAGFGVVLSKVRNFFWWFPAISILIFAVWLYLSLETTVVRWYSVVQKDLRVMGLLAQHEHEAPVSLEETYTASLVRRGLSFLPKASDDDDAGGETKEAESAAPAIPAQAATMKPSQEAVTKAEEQAEPALVPSASQEEGPSETPSSEPALRRSTRRRKSPSYSN